jgi:hypothetical protein
MTDAALPPRNSVVRFGVSFVGPSFLWAYTEKAEDSDELVVKERTFRAHPGLSFEEQLAYTRSLTMLQATAVIEQRHLEKVVAAISELPDDTDPTEALEALADETAEGERKRWALQIDQVTMLVAPAEREAFRTIVSEANPADVRALKDHLVGIVVLRTPQIVEAAAGVDPTSPPSSSD